MEDRRRATFFTIGIVESHHQQVFVRSGPFDVRDQSFAIDVALHSVRHQHDDVAGLQREIRNADVEVWAGSQRACQERARNVLKRIVRG